MPSPTAIEKIRAFNRFYTNIIGVVDRHLLGTPYSLTEARIMLEIYHQGHCSARSIKQMLNVDEGYLSRTIDKLVGKGLINKRRSREDGRVHELTLSARGRKAFLDLKQRMESVIGGLIHHLSDNEVNELVGHMHRIQQLLTSSGVRT